MTYLYNKTQIHILIFLVLEVLFLLVHLKYLILLFIIIIASCPNSCKSNPCLFKIIVDNEAKLALKSSPGKSNLPCDKFLFKCPKCELIYKFIPM